MYQLYIVIPVKVKRELDQLLSKHDITRIRPNLATEIMNAYGRRKNRQINANELNVEFFINAIYSRAEVYTPNQMATQDQM